MERMMWGVSEEAMGEKELQNLINPGLNKN